MTYLIDMGKMLLGIFIIVFVVGFIVKAFAYAATALMIVVGLVIAAALCFAGLLIGDRIVELFKS